MEENLSPIMAAVEPAANDFGEEEFEKENSTEESEDVFARIWNAALATRPANWQAALSRVPGGTEGGLPSFQFGSKVVQCRLMGSDMLVVDGKSQVLLDRFLDRHGDLLVNGPPSGAPPVAPAPQPAVASTAEFKKPAAGGLRFKNLKKQPLTQSNEMDT